MPIKFTINQDEGYFVSRHIGTISETELLAAYRGLFEGKEWPPGLNELVDLSEADLGEITTSGVRKFAAYNESVYKMHDVTSTKNAVYAPTDFPFGLARMYSFMATESLV